MGRSPRPKPRELSDKLLRIRVFLGLSQTEMVEHLNFKLGYLSASHISELENDKREPSLPLLLRYSRVARVSVEMIIDDKLELPEGY